MPLIPLVQYTLENEQITFQAENQPLKKLSIKEFNKLFGMNYFHGIVCDSSHKDLLNAVKKFKKEGDSELNKKVANFIEQKSPHYAFSIRYINKTFGTGLFTDEAIPAGAIGGIYSGELLASPMYEPEGDWTYDMVWDCNKFQFRNTQYHFALRGKDYGDLTRFALHLPLKEDIRSLDSSIKNAILTANLECRAAVYKDTSLNVFLATEDIPANTVAGFTYGNHYWNAKEVKPDYFLKEKNALRIVSYQANKKKYEKTQEIIKLTPNTEKKDSSSKSYYDGQTQTLFSSTKPSARAQYQKLAPPPFLVASYHYQIPYKSDFQTPAESALNKTESSKPRPR